jgi:NAD+ synthase (glutamine-hydrolysing)
MKGVVFALAQIDPTVGDLEGNTTKIRQFIQKAREKGAQIVVFPELAVTGYPPKDLVLKPDFVSKNMELTKGIAKETKGICAILGFVEEFPCINTERGKEAREQEEKGVRYNSAAVFCDGVLKGVYRKQKLPNYDVFDEKRYFEAGKNPGVFDLKGTKVGVNICEDIWVGDGPIKEQAKKADVIVNLSASPFHAGKSKERRALLSKRAKDFKVPIIYVNMVGCQDDLIFDGRSCVFDKRGILIAQGKEFEEDLVISGTEGKALKVEEESIKEIHDAIVLGIRDYARKNGFSKAVIGISGGIDSSVVIALAVEALGKENVRGVSMPSHITSRQSIDDAKKVAVNLGVPFKLIQITDIYNSYIRALEQEFAVTKMNVTEENIQARIRGNILMALSNKFGYLVLTTGNKSEVAVGYCTLYGDMAGGLAVLSDVPKTTVYKLAEYINRKKKIIPKEVIEKEPTAELRPNQKDTDSLPPYEVLDPILDAYIEKNKGRDEILRMKFEKGTVDKVIGMVDHNEYKREQSPIGLRITSKAFGSGRRMPITNRYKP